MLVIFFLLGTERVIYTLKATESIARQPEAAGKIQSALILGAGLSEATAIYGLITAILLIFA